MIGTYRDDEAILDFIGSHEAPRLVQQGTSCPDHFLRTKIKPLYINWDPQKGDVAALKQALTEGLEQYRKGYADYYNKHKHADSPAMRDPNPTVILIPGLGMVAWGKDKSEARVTAEFYNCAVEVMRGQIPGTDFTSAHGAQLLRGREFVKVAHGVTDIPVSSECAADAMVCMVP